MCCKTHFQNAERALFFWHENVHYFQMEFRLDVVLARPRARKLNS